MYSIGMWMHASAGRCRCLSRLRLALMLVLMCWIGNITTMVCLHPDAGNIAWPQPCTR